MFKALKQYLNEIFSLLENDQKRLPWLILLFLSSSILDLIGLGLVGPFVSLIISPDSITKGPIGNFLVDLGFSIQVHDLLVSIGFILIIVFLIKSISAIAIHRKILKFIVNRQINLQSFFMEGFQSLPYVSYVNRNSSEYINTIGHLVMTFTGGVLHNGLHLLSEGFVGILVLSFLAYTDILALGILVIIFGLSIFIYDSFFRHKLKNYGKQISIGHTEMLTGIQEGFSGFKEIKILGKAPFFKQIVVNGANKAASSQINSGVIKKAPSYIFEFIVIAFIVIYAVVSLALVNDMVKIVGSMGIFMVASLRMKPIANSVISGISSARLGRYAVSLIYKDYLEIKSRSFVNPNYKRESKPFSSLILKNASFKYPKSSELALNDISLSLNVGESIGLIGPSGSGKTTLVDVILGLLEPQLGQILYNNRPLSNSLNTWQKTVAYLPQEVFLFDHSLKQNIVLSLNEENVDINKMMEAIQKAKLTELVNELPNGIETILGEKGVRLSGGQRQRVAIARAFYHQRTILVMDEATSALDDKTEKEIVEEIKDLKKQKTIIVIAHRLSTVKYCDRIYRLDKGEIVETGSYDQVVNKN